MYILEDFFPHPRVHGGRKNLQIYFILEYKGKAFSKNPISPVQKVSVSVVICILYWLILILYAGSTNLELQ